MRELYACQLDLMEAPSRPSVARLVEEWVARGSGAEIGTLQPSDPQPFMTCLGHTLECEVVPLENGDGWICSWASPDDADPSLVWRRLLGIGPADAGGQVRFTVRIGLERAGDEFQVAPPRYAFGSPAIVRTLLKEHSAYDGAVRVEPRYRVRRAVDIPALVDLVLADTRRLPVLVLTRSPDGDRLVDAAELARQLAGLAHVEVLPTHLAAMALIERLGGPLSAWGGAARLYWPRMSPSDDPRRHTLWSPSHLRAQGNFIERTRSWLGGLAAASAPEHPAATAARSIQRARLHGDAEVPTWITEYVETLESSLDQAQRELRTLRDELAGSREAEERLVDELVGVREQFRIVQAATVDLIDEPVDLESLTIAEAFQLARDEADEHVVYLPECEKSIAAFSSYNSPRRLYEALTTVSEAAAAWNSGDLGPGFGQYFASQGYEYSQRNPAATARTTKAHYKRKYGNDTITMEPHLKVDQATHPDQCLRIYWAIDDEKHCLVIGHVGRHLPD